MGCCQSDKIVLSKEDSKKKIDEKKNNKRTKG